MKLKALITAAGIGKRLGALTASKNKALLHVGKKALITHIVEKLRARGIRDIRVVTGFQAGQVEKALGRDARAVFNPFYRVSGILASFWQARAALDGHAFVFTTSDHFFHPSVLADCLKPGADVRIVVQKKPVYTREDAKVLLRGPRVVAISKDLPVRSAQGEFGGMVFFSARASKIFFEELERHFKKGDLGGYMMEVLRASCDRHGVPIRYSICGRNTRIEVDSVHDLIAARRLAGRFRARKKPR